MATAAVTRQHPFQGNGEKIRRARLLVPSPRDNQRPISQEDFAPLVGTVRRNLIRLENGEHLPSGELRDRIVAETGTEEKIVAEDDEDAHQMNRRLIARTFEILEENRRKASLLTVVAALAFAGTAVAQPNLRPADRLTQIASTAAHKPITVTPDPASPASGQTPVVGGNQILLGTLVYRSAAHGDSYGLFILLHETGHATGITDEHQADCFALNHFKHALKVFHFTPKQQRWHWLDALEINRESLNGYGCQR